MQKTVLIINGSGLSDSDISGSDRYDGVTLAMIRKACEELCGELNLNLDFQQIDDFKELLSLLTKESSDKGKVDAVIVNPLGYAREEDFDFSAYCEVIDQLKQAKKPISEVHLSNVYTQSRDVALPHHKPGGEMGFISGFGVDGYLLAIRSLAEKLQN